MSRATNARSFAWVAADTGGTTVISLAALLVMARLIGPHDFGAAAIAVGVVQVVNLYVEGLLHDALIQNRDVSEEAFDQGFWLCAGVGIAVAAVAGAAWLALRGGEAATLALLIFASACTLPFSGMTGVLNARLRRDMDYRLVAAPSVAAKLLSAVAGLAAAALGWGAWSLVTQFLVGAGVQALGLFLSSGWRPRPPRTFAALKPLWGFALPYALMHTLVGARIQAFTTATAALGGLAAAGYINVAFRPTLNPQILLMTALSNVGLPLLSRHQHDRPALEASFHRLNRFNALGLPVVFFGVAACADLIVRVLLGTQWLPSIAPMQVFAIGAAFYFLRMPATLLLRALGRVRYSLMNSVMHLVVTLGAMLWLRPHDALTASLLWVAPLAPLLPITLYVVRRETGVSAALQLKGVAGPTLCAAGMAAAVWAVRPWLTGLPAPAQLAACVALGATVYLLLVLATDGQARREAASAAGMAARRLRPAA